MDEASASRLRSTLELQGRRVYRLLAIDMDGTLISRDRPLSDDTRNALNALIRRGYHVVMATGRSLDFIRHHCPGIELTGPQITYNGAVIADAATGRTLSMSLLPEGMASAVVNFLLDADIPPITCAIDHVYLDRRIPDPEDWVAPGRDGTFLEDIRQAPIKGLIKVVGESDEEAITRIRPRAHAEFDSSLYVTQTSPRLIEFLNPQASKGAALRQIAEWLGISRDEIIAFGDSHNDIAMFEVAGLSVAMGNASDEVKQAADRVTLRSEEDGVVAVLRDLNLVV
jgi:Cof subfamily protein (haloacid dehalogenase superfamily)